MSIEKPALKGLKRANKARWLKPEIRVRVQHPETKGTLRHATVKARQPDPWPVDRADAIAPGQVAPLDDWVIDVKPAE